MSDIHSALIERVVNEVIGQRCEGADNPYGSIIRLDIGEMSKPDSAAPGDLLHGWRHFTIYSPWRVSTPSGVLFDWNEPGGTMGTLSKRLLALVGQTVVDGCVSPPSNDLRIQFSNDLTLEVFSDLDDDGEDAWFVLGTDGLELGVRPMLAEPGDDVELRRK